MDTTAWLQRLQHLIVDTGAELVVEDPDGTVAFTAALARAWRLDDAPSCLWLRPITAPTHDDGTPVFALAQCRPRALDVDTVQPDAADIVIALRTGQRARIRPATGRTADHLDAWDTFVGARLTADEELALDALAEDSWTGRYA